MHVCVDSTHLKKFEKQKLLRLSLVVALVTKLIERNLFSFRLINRL